MTITNALVIDEMPMHKNFRKVRWRNFLWLRPWIHRRFLWHFHCSSSILFCGLVTLNFLDGVVPFTGQQNQTENSLDYNPTTNTTINRNKNYEDELTREILALFDYDEKGGDGKGSTEKWTVDDERVGEQANNGTKGNWTSGGLDAKQLVEFNVDPPSAADQSNLTNRWAMVSDDEQTNRKESSEKGQQQLSADHLLNGTPVDHFINGTPADHFINGTPADHFINGTPADHFINGDQLMNDTTQEKMAPQTTATESTNSSSTMAPLNLTSFALTTQANLEPMTIEKETNTSETEMAQTVPKLETDGQSTEMPTQRTAQVKVTTAEKDATSMTPEKGSSMGRVKSKLAEGDATISTLNFSDIATASSKSSVEKSTNGTFSNGIATLSPMPNFGNESNEIETDAKMECQNETILGIEMTATKSSGESENSGISHRNQTTETPENLFHPDNASTTGLVVFVESEAEFSLAFSPTTDSTAMATPNYDANGTVVAEEDSRRVKEVNGTEAAEGVKEMLEELKRRMEGKMRIGGVEYVELNEYRQQLRNILSDVDSALSKWGSQLAHLSDFPKSRRLISISASMPNRNSDLFIARKNAISASVASNFEEIRKSPTKLGTTSVITTQTEQQIQTENVPNLTGSEKVKQEEKIEEEKETEKIVGKKGETTMEMEEKGTNAKGTMGQKEKTEEKKTKTTETVARPSNSLKPMSMSSEADMEERPKNGAKKAVPFRTEHFASKYFSLSPLRNASAVDHCKHLAQDDLVHELKQKGTYNPELMAWDVSGVFRFLDKTITDQYERQTKPPKSNDQAVRRNVEALERLLSELNLSCDVRSPEVMLRVGNLTMSDSKRSVISPSLRQQKELMRRKRGSLLAEQLGVQREKSRKRRATEDETKQRQQRTRKKKQQQMIGDVHAVPFGCDKRGDSEDGYLRLCGACQSIRKLPDEFFPPFINEVVCDEDKACLYFYDYPHGKCKQKHMNFVVLKNVGTPLCQIWEKFNLNVRVSCECFVDEMSFFSKYV